MMIAGSRMEKKKKLMSAIAGAVMSYIKLEEEARAKMVLQPGIGLNLWGISARQDTMQLRRLYQLRLPKR